MGASAYVHNLRARDFELEGSQGTGVDWVGFSDGLRVFYFFMIDIWHMRQIPKNSDTGLERKFRKWVILYLFWSWPVVKHALVLKGFPTNVMVTSTWPQCGSGWDLTARWYQWRSNADPNFTSQGLSEEQKPMGSQLYCSRSFRGIKTNWIETDM